MKRTWHRSHFAAQETQEISQKKTSMMIVWSWLRHYEEDNDVEGGVHGHGNDDEEEEEEDDDDETGDQNHIWWWLYISPGQFINQMSISLPLCLKEADGCRGRGDWKGCHHCHWWGDTATACKKYGTEEKACAAAV